MRKKGIGRYFITREIIILLFFISPLVSCFQPMAKTDKLTLTQDIPMEYKSLFNYTDTSQFKPVISYNTKYRFPFTLIDYKTKYELIIYKISDSISEALPNLIKVEQAFSNNKINIIYTVVNETNFNLAFSPDTSNKIESINLNLFGDSIQNIIKSDSMFGYYLKFNQISWSRNAHDKLDVYIEPDGNITKTTRIPTSIMFIKRRNNLYFVLLSVNNSDGYFDKHLLQNLLAK